MCNCKGARTVAPRAAPPTIPKTPRVRAVPTAPVPKPVRTAAPVPKPVRAVPTTAVSVARNTRPLPNYSRSWTLSPVPTRTKSGLIAYATTLWGPSMWKAIHTAVEVGDIEKVAVIPAALDGALPCPDCEKHYHQWLVAHPVPSERDALRKWFVDLHNSVNARTRKAPWTQEQVIAAYGGDDAAAAAHAAVTTVERMVGASAIAALRAALPT